MPKIKDLVYVTLQFSLILGYFFIPRFLAFELPNYIQIFALILSIFGLFIIVLALIQLNKNLTPFPSPKANAVLIKEGLYRYVRHPIYTGIIFFVFFYALHTHHLPRLFLALLLYGLFSFKSIYEEAMLINKFAEYKNYQKHTGRFFPRLKALSP
ncbi:methyltransferase family protein [Pedobacter cryophilus]|uniref:Isoprenylcysteine carboxylmethyltransferase family protein n=1 Tax=Pedobacter cryophilus TaxID=2571271 RepID=A0A4U1BXD5_9SPHI|nr:isoprenylcysteine carboxylmethyltransferase family protein [Pedobacter cryophilus]TKB97672.1 isoprenylcysteine carboxylmethyltransferase family protein [Pedobacter cryophilus]